MSGVVTIIKAFIAFEEKAKKTNAENRATCLDDLPKTTALEAFDATLPKYITMALYDNALARACMTPIITTR